MPPCQMIGVGSVVAGLATVLSMVPLCSYARVECLQGVAFASSHPNTERTARLVAPSPAERLCKLAVLLPRWTLGAEPKDLLAAF